ncbi:amino acid adenylation domain-containing protein [Ensifer sp. ENS06]|uniref:non-ribosomal peptide synthetase n=1 Tax=Ensifer sp. ENS06 TaxID=2769276 RepID=UPI00177E316A|nr:non-ribosomal peptide synthetase [Ensifer sp. ENS06]MBD9628171.1 amino acid adenylation domain-containing protein [Ensifer sp. ENS06]
MNAPHLTRSSRDSIAERLAARRDRRSPVVADPAARHEPFPLSDMQYAYWVGRDNALEDAGAIQFYLEFRTGDLDLAKLEAAWNRLIERHDMLRAVVTDDGKQRVLATVPRQTIAMEDLSRATEVEQDRLLEEKRNRLQKESADLTSWPHSHLSFTKLAADGVGHLHMKLDIWCTDGRSIQIMFDELAAFYEDPDRAMPETDLSFRDYMLAVERFENGPEWQKSFGWWQERLRHLPPPPPLPIRRISRAGGLQTFVRLDDRLDAEQIRSLRAHASGRGLTLACVVLAAYAEVLGRWSGTNDFTVNVPRFNRLDWHKDIDQIIGEFASFSLLEVRGDGGQSFEGRARAIQQQMWQDLEHQSVSGVRQLREYARHRGGMEAGAMPIVFTTLPERRPGDSGDITHRLGFLGEIVQLVSRTPQVWIDCQYGEYGDALMFNWDVIESLFPPGLVRSMFESFSSLLKRLATDSDTWSSPAPLELPAEQLTRRTAVNATVFASEEKTPLSRFLGHAARTPDAVAVVDAAGAELTYGGLALEAAGIAAQLTAAGAKAGDRVAILLAKGWRQPAAIMATQMLGCAYVPLDPANPAERVARILSIAKPVALIADRDVAPGDEIAVIGLAEKPAGLARAIPAAPAFDGDAILSIIFTSGTTGQPKGVMISMRGIANALQFSERHFDLSSRDRFIAITGLHHDMAMFDIFGPLGVGGAVVFPDARRDVDPGHWLDLIHRYGVTLWNSVPRFMELLATEAERQSMRLPEGFRQVILGGDWLPVDLPARLRALQPTIRVTSAGGPTETTLWNITHDAFDRPEDCPSIPYGKPIGNSHYHILDEALRDCPEWMPGEMYCSGVCVSPGYFDDPVLTAEKFVIHPTTGERLYRTGDRGCYRPDGSIEFLGRSDFQLNLGGYRADALEIEAAINACPGIQDAVVVSHGDKESAAKIVAFYRTNGVPPSEMELRAWCGERLPPPLVPRAFQLVDLYPLNANGKVDRRVLGTVDLQVEPGAAGGVPQTPLESFVAALWQEVLQQPVATTDANYFELGGDSLNAMRILLKIEETLGLRPPLALVFTHATVGEFAAGLLELIAARTATPPTIEESLG